MLIRTPLSSLFLFYFCIVFFFFGCGGEGSGLERSSLNESSLNAREASLEQSLLREDVMSLLEPHLVADTQRNNWHLLLSIMEERFGPSLYHQELNEERQVEIYFGEGPREVSVLEVGEELSVPLGLLSYNDPELSWEEVQARVAATYGIVGASPRVTARSVGFSYNISTPQSSADLGEPPAGGRNPLRAFPWEPSDPGEPPTGPHPETFPWGEDVDPRGDPNRNPDDDFPEVPVPPFEDIEPPSEEDFPEFPDLPTNPDPLKGPWNPFNPSGPFGLGGEDEDCPGGNCGVPEEPADDGDDALECVRVCKEILWNNYFYWQCREVWEGTDTLCGEETIYCIGPYDPANGHYAQPVGTPPPAEGTPGGHPSFDSAEAACAGG